MSASDRNSAAWLVRGLCQGGRESGSPEAADARGRIAAFLLRNGWSVEEQPFRYHPAAPMALPLLGAGLGWLGLLLIPLLTLPAIPVWTALAVWVVGLGGVIAMSAAAAFGWSSFGREPRQDSNLIARPAAGLRPRIWVSAHYDTKAQGHSMAGRLVAVWVLALGLVGQLALVVWRFRETPPLAAVAATAALAVAAGFLSGRGRLRGRSPGARDNGSGLLAALEAAEAAREAGVGLLVTGAEEFGLVGARVLAQEQPDLVRGSIVVNFDTVDDRGRYRVVTHDATGRALAREAVASMAGELLPRIHRLPAGILVDSVAFARAGAGSITFARLDWETFRRIHTPRDTLDGLTFESAIGLGRWVGGWLAGRGEDPAAI
ncbi:MAG: M28 family peptidase [Gemmatimonadales bacterium]